MRGTLLILVLGFVGLLGLGLMTTIPVGATAQDVQEAVGTDATADQATVDAAVKLLQQEQRRRFVFLFVAYMVIWLIWSGYALYLSQKQSRLNEEIRRLRE